MNVLNIPSFIINLDKDKKRLNNAIDQIKEFKPIRFPAVNGNDLTNHEINKLVTHRAKINIGNERRDHFGIYTKGAIGCYLSHVKLWQHIVHNNIPMALIFEDDVVKTTDFDITIMNNQINQSFNYAKQISKELVCIFFYISDRGSVKIGSNDLFQVNNLFGLSSYLITYHGARELLNGVFPIEVQLDYYVSIRAQLDGLLMMYSKPLLFKQMNYESNIQTICVDCAYYDYRYVMIFFVCLLIIIIFISIYIFYNKKYCEPN